MTHSGARRAGVLTLMALAMVSCSREQPSDAISGPEAVATVPVQAPVKLEDVLEITPGHVIGISYPEQEIRYPRLAAELKAYADGAREEFMEAVNSRDRDGGADDRMLYDLSLNFTEVLDSPQLVAYAVEGSSFTGGAHGAPMLARFVWLPQQDQRLAATDLIPGASGWPVIAGYVREQLHTALSQRVDASELEPGERAEMIKNAGRMIDEGTDADPENFAQFEPVVNAAGKLVALRFVFPPYQVGPYSDGVHTVDVPAAVLLPHVAPQYRDLFTGD